MRPSPPAFVRILTRKQLALENKGAALPRTLSAPLRSDIKNPTLIETLNDIKKQAGEAFPSNVRIEPVLQRRVLAKVEPEVRKQFLEMMKEH